MRINLTSILVLTGFFVACGGTGENFSEAGAESSGFGGSGGANGSTQGGSSGYDASYDTNPPDTGKDTMSGCSATCTSNSECQSACGSTSTYCCDIPTGACYPTSLSTCPSPIPDSGGGSMYGG